MNICIFECCSLLIKRDGERERERERVQTFEMPQKSTAIESAKIAVAASGLCVCIYLEIYSQKLTISLDFVH